MILIWRGWGLLAAAVLIPVLGSCAGLIDREPIGLFVVALGASFLVAGAVCGYCGVRWNRHRIDHSLYFVPLQWWGWMYLAVAALISFGAISRASREGLGKPPFLWVGIAGAVGFFVVVCTAVWLLWAGRKWAQVALAEGGPAPVEEPPVPDEDWSSIPEKPSPQPAPTMDYSKLPKFGR